MKGNAGKEERQLLPYLARERGFGAGSEDEDTNGWGMETETFYSTIGTGAGRVKGVAEGAKGLQAFVCETAVSANIVRAEFGEYAADSDWVGQELGCLT